MAVPGSRRSRTPPGYLRQTKTALGWLYYPYLKPNRYALLHAEVESSHQRQGVAGATVRRVLDEIRAREGTITAICSFVAEHLSRTATDADLIDARHSNRAAAESARASTSAGGDLLLVE
ncbi:hypothetical protein GCM10023195_55420 [Actinoallomurus liliacearum]|uniref:N-acetyltransferase domain-containing protein n=1 Tax=Actinoallomurus liliacearum TaxID=1080073 RepID=A0ABP8TSZ9_9ACTN